MENSSTFTFQGYPRRIPKVFLGGLEEQSEPSNFFERKSEEMCLWSIFNVNRNLPNSLATLATT